VRRNRFACMLFMVSIISAVLINILPVPANGTTEPGAVAEGKVLPEFSLDIPVDPEMKQYLGVDGDAGFTLNQVQSKLILLEVFSAMCPACLKNAPRVNKLYKIISRDSDLKSSIVMMGIAVGNKEKLVKAYRKKYKVKFPVFSDPNGDIDNLLTGISTPTLLIADKSGKVLFVHGGPIDDMDYILAVIRSFNGE